MSHIVAAYPYPPISIGGNAQDAAALLLRHANQHHPHPTWQIQQQLLIRICRIAQAAVDAVKAPKFRSIRMQDHLVTSWLGHWNRKAFVGIARMKGKHKNQVATGVGQHLFSGLQVQLLGGSIRK